MKTQHTPEPWIINSEAFDNEGGEITVTETDKDGQLIAAIYGETVESNMANAKLIAASPQLLKALKNLYKDAEDRGELIDPETGELYDDWKLAKEAIKKSEL
jgi:hypothetical protein